MNEYQFKPEIAILYGVNEAIFLHSLSFWLAKNRSNRINFHDGRYWSYDTYKAIAERFPFWTVRQVERIISNCKEQGAILVGNYNEDKTDRTKWYTLAGEAEDIYFPKTVECIPPNGEMHVPQGIEADTVRDEPIPPNGEMQFTEAGDPFHQTVDCIKGTVTNQLSNTPHKPPKGGRRKGTGLSDKARAMLNEYVAGDQELTEAMVALMEMRELSPKAKNTDRAVKMLLAELDELSGGEREAKLKIIKQSVLSGWAGVFPLKGGTAAPLKRKEVRHVE